MGCAGVPLPAGVPEEQNEGGAEAVMEGVSVALPVPRWEAVPHAEVVTLMRGEAVEEGVAVPLGEPEGLLEERVDTVGEAVTDAERVCEVVTEGVREPGREGLTVGELVAAAVAEWDRCGERDEEGQGEDELEPRGVLDTTGDSDAATEDDAELEIEGEREAELEPRPEREMVVVMEPLAVALGDAVDVALPE